jgi:hypothetical protein
MKQRSDKGTIWLQKHNIKIKQRSDEGTIWLQKHNIEINLCQTFVLS